METLTPAAIYRAIFAGETVSVSCSAEQYPSLRVAIQRQHQLPRALDLTSQSVKASFDKTKGLATFSLGAKRVPRGYAVISETPDAQTL